MKNSDSATNNTPVRKEYLVYGQPKIDNDCIKEVTDVLKSNWIGTGPKVKLFEDNFKTYKGVSYAIALNSCTAGLHLALLGSGINPGDDVLVPSMTFCATVNTIEHVGAKPVFLDCDSTMNVTLAEIKNRITPKTKAIVVVHFAGRCVTDIEEIARYAKEKNIHLIEDCAHAIETKINGKPAGCFGDIGVFSFYATKNITTAEGGMLITNNEKIAEKVKVLALHGMSKDAWKRFSDDGYKHYEVEYPGYKYNMTDVAAAMGVVQLSKIDAYYKRRAEIWKKYQDELIGLPVVLPAQPCENEIHAFHLFPILLDTDKVDITRDQLIMLLHKENIGTGVHYRAVHLQPFYRDKYSIKAEDYPVANYISERTLSIPFSQYLTDQDTDDVINALKKVLLQHAK
jgi:dTDP-4-amino-4,6-dideoxygalactose transaminase